MTNLGEIAALVSALLWAVASVIYARLGTWLSPLVLNLLKGIVAIALLGVTLLIRQESLSTVDRGTIVLLSLSGVLGIGLGDTFYFETLNRLGARRSLLLESLAPTLAALLALIFLRETLSWWNWLGIGLTIAGVIWVINERPPQPNLKPKLQAPIYPATIPAQNDRHSPPNLTPAGTKPDLPFPWLGVSYGLLAALSQSGGAVLSRAALTQSTISPLWSALVRLVAGGLGILVWLMGQQLYRPSPQLTPQPTVMPPDSIWTKLLRPGTIATIIITAFIGTYLGIWLQQTAYKHTAVGIAQALNATSPLFVLPIVRLLGEPVTLRAVWGVLIALSGVALLFQSSS